MMSQVSLVECPDYQPDAVSKAVRQAIDLLGGISLFVQPKTRVLLKPNLLLAKEPQYGITTHPQVLRAVIRLLKELDCQIFVGDGPSVWAGEIENVDKVYRVSGTEAVCAEEKVKLVKFDQRRWRGKFPLASWLDECDYLVNLPKFKTHGMTILTGAIKNLFGLVSGTYKTELHKNFFAKEDFARVLVDIYELARPALTLVDGIEAIEGEGPGTSGKLRQVGVILASSDAVAIDAILARIMGVEPSAVLTTQEAAGRNLGAGEFSQIEILGQRLEDVIGAPFQLPASTSLARSLPLPVVNLAKRLIRYYPRINKDKCSRCGACIKVCPEKIIRLGPKGPVFNYQKCIACFCCQEACPNAAISIQKSFLAKCIGL